MLIQNWPRGWDNTSRNYKKDFLNNEPCRTCNGTRLGKQGKKKIPIYNVRVTSIDRRIRSYQEYTMKKIEQQRTLGFIVEIIQ